MDRGEFEEYAKTLLLRGEPVPPPYMALEMEHPHKLRFVIATAANYACFFREFPSAKYAYRAIAAHIWWPKLDYYKTQPLSTPRSILVGESLRVNYELVRVDSFDAPR